jgi:hypothetical protein
MGIIKSFTDHSGLVVNGVILGNPVEVDNDPLTYEWCDGMFPDGELDAEGTLTVSDVE